MCIHLEPTKTIFPGETRQTVISVPLLISFLCENNKNNFYKKSACKCREESRQNAVSAPLLIPFSGKNEKKTVLTKNLLANDVTKHVRLIFSPAGEILSLFSDIQTVVPFKVF